MQTRLLAVIAATAIVTAVSIPAPLAQAQGASRTVWAVTMDGRSVEGKLSLESLSIAVNGAQRKVALRELRSFHSADAASPEEAARILADSINFTRLGQMAVRGEKMPSMEQTAMVMPAH